MEKFDPALAAQLAIQSNPGLRETFPVRPSQLMP
jgi:hypothetical protein